MIYFWDIYKKSVLQIEVWQPESFAPGVLWKTEIAQQCFHKVTSDLLSGAISFSNCWFTALDSFYYGFFQLKLYSLLGRIRLCIPKIKSVWASVILGWPC